ncbi:MAG: hypothetical protein HZB24_03770 [Desulfobacterales bacterium]|nr:hypothetical protein [Desulfobacterales bacterium]
MQQFDDDPVRGLQKSDTEIGPEVHGIDGENYPLALQFIAIGIQIATNMEAKMVNAPLESLPLGRFFASALPSDDNGCAFKRQQELWGASHLCFGSDGAPRKKLCARSLGCSCVVIY